jgi:hypothetical protein
MVTFSHPKYRGAYGDAGGPFFLKKVKHHVQEQDYVRENPNTHVHLFEGPIMPGSVPGHAFGIDPLTASDSQLDTWGATLVNHALPTVPAFSLSLALGELKKDGLPHVVGMSTLKEKTAYLKSSGDEYLNVQFGWAPLMQDLRGFASVVKSSNKHVRGYVAGRDARVRRRRTLPATSSSSYYTGTNGILRPTNLNLNANVHAGTTESQEIWFSGAFRYFVPMPEGVIGTLRYAEQQSNLLLGTRLTPEVVWQLAPWSWAANWFSNVGDVIGNISALGEDSLVMQYGYVMHHSEKEQFMHMTRASAPGTPAIDTFYRKTVSVKQRRPASPFGFGSTWDGLTATQLAIATALGLSRSNL